MKKKILVMEDNGSLLDTYMDILESEGYDVHLALNGADGWAIIERETIDLIISDGRMPLLSGYDVLLMRKANPRAAAIPFIMVTGTPPSDMAGILNQAPPDLHLCKPVRPKELLTAVDRFLA